MLTVLASKESPLRESTLDECESDPAAASIANNRSRTKTKTKTKKERERERPRSVGRNVGGNGDGTDVKAPAATLWRKGGRKMESAKNTRERREGERRRFGEGVQRPAGKSEGGG